MCCFAQLQTLPPDTVSDRWQDWWALAIDRPKVTTSALVSVLPQRASGATQMTKTYTFRYLNADGSFNGIAVVQLDDRYSAELSAKNLMPNKAASVEIWCGDDLIGTERNAQPDTPDHSSAHALSHP